LACTVSDSMVAVWKVSYFVTSSLDLCVTQLWHMF